MVHNGVSHEARAKKVLLGYVIDRKFHPYNNGCSLCCGDNALRKRKVKLVSMTGTLPQYNSD